jgi:hypothetical protein
MWGALSKSFDAAVAGVACCTRLDLTQKARTFRFYCKGTVLKCGVYSALCFQDIGSYLVSIPKLSGTRCSLKQQTPKVVWIPVTSKLFVQEVPAMVSDENSSIKSVQLDLTCCSPKEVWWWSVSNHKPPKTLVLVWACWYPSVYGKGHSL